MRGVHRGVITLELVISLGLMATLCAAIMPSITAMVQSVRILSRRVEDRSTSLFIADFLTEKIRNTVEGVEKEARQGNTYDYREEMQDGTWQTYTLRQQGSRLEIRIPGRYCTPRCIPMRNILIRGTYGKSKGRSKCTSSVPYDGSYRSGRRTAGYDCTVAYGGLLL